MTHAAGSPIWSAALLTMALIQPALAQVTPAPTPDFSGTWKLDRSRSRISDAAGLAGLIAAGAPDTLHVTQPANGTLVIESQINEGHARIYRPGGTTSTSAGQSGTITMATKWEARTLVSEGTRAAASGAAAAVREAIALAPDGTLTIDVITTEGDRKNASTLMYARIQTVGPCESWPTPCKRPPN